MARGAQLRDADARPHPTVGVARPGSGRSGPGDELGGGAFGRPRSGVYGVPGRKRRAGLDGEAHRECSGGLIKLGEGLVTTEGRR